MIKYIKHIHKIKSEITLITIGMACVCPHETQQIN